MSTRVVFLLVLLLIPNARASHNPIITYTHHDDCLALAALAAEIESEQPERGPEWGGVLATWYEAGFDDPCGPEVSEWQSPTHAGVECRGAPDRDGARRITNLHLPDRGLRGSVPRSLGAFRALREIDLDSNSLTGTLPAELACVTSLIELDLANNGGIVGGIPREWGALTLLQELEFELNSGMRGCVPDGLPPPAVTCAYGAGAPAGAPPCAPGTRDPIVGTSIRGSGLGGACWEETQREALRKSSPSGGRDQGGWGYSPTSGADGLRSRIFGGRWGVGGGRRQGDGWVESRSLRPAPPRDDAPLVRDLSLAPLVPPPPVVCPSPEDWLAMMTHR